MIKGWDIGVETMTVGETAILNIPYTYAYGDAGTGPIPAKADLIFKLELLEAKDNKNLLDSVMVQVLIVMGFAAFIVFYVVPPDKRWGR